MRRNWIPRYPVKSDNVPAARRRFGYFCLPILYRDRFAGVVDLKVDRVAGLLRIKALHWKEAPGSGLLTGFNKALGEFAGFHGLAAKST
ncbi:crosslink repair DNA glycosylase YcaQ family protein [Microbulbifer bruguierae]|uniref:Crosslink repair DNA glycosylase YcaQ family protein n=1 Tax=Microbulbifer bruguierae TaxID=3029061 RepID=A0ABY8NE03_9GAMM|nr:crosslink repair DNA glycosylase YcaQ family protein [Microbulbifer bruguierae]